MWVAKQVFCYEEEVGMPVVKLSLTDAAYNKLKADAAAQGVTMQDLIRSRALEDEGMIFTATDAVERAKTKFNVGDVFTVPEIYGDEWASMDFRKAGTFGKSFNQYVNNHCVNTIQDLGKKSNSNHQLYKLVSK